MHLAPRTHGKFGLELPDRFDFRAGRELLENLLEVDLNVVIAVALAA